MTAPFTIPLPTYQCHKRVQALRIKAVIANPRGYELHFEDERFCPIEVSDEWIGKHCPERGYEVACDEVLSGGYLVIYEDGYQSWSPAALFEAGYTLVEGEPAEMVSVQEVWEAAGGNPGIKATKADLMVALRQLDDVCELADTVGPATQAAREVATAPDGGPVFRDCKMRVINPGDELIWEECGIKRVGKVEADPSYNGGMRVAGNSIPHLIDVADWIEVVK